MGRGPPPTPPMRAKNLNKENASKSDQIIREDWKCAERVNWFNYGEKACSEKGVTRTEG